MPAVRVGAAIGVGKDALARAEALVAAHVDVLVIDMDWHVTDIPEKYGSGWTGYTWSKTYFPDPPAFLDWVHRQAID